MKNLGRMLNVAIFIVAVVGLSFQAVDFLSRPRSGLSADIEYGVFRTPQSLADEIGRLEPLTIGDSLIVGIPHNHLSPEDADRVGEYLLNKLPTSHSLATDLLGGYWVAWVHNVGATTLSDVTITLPHTRYVSVSHPGADVINRESGPVVPLGVFRPKETMEVYAWTGTSVDKYDARSIVLTHSSGTGGVQVRVPVGNFGQWAEGALDFFRFTALIWMIFAVYLLGRIAMGVWGQRRDAKQESSIAPD